DRAASAHRGRRPRPADRYGGGCAPPPYPGHLEHHRSGLRRGAGAVRHGAGAPGTAGRRVSGGCGRSGLARPTPGLGRGGGDAPARQRGVNVRIDVVTIFPDYLAPLDLSLPGKARERGLLDLHVHDLRTYTRDRHRSVDDTPYGGGAGMVMRPEPWGAAIDAIAPGPQAPRLSVPTPSGVPFGQHDEGRVAP